VPTTGIHCDLHGLYEAYELLLILYYEIYGSGWQLQAHALPPKEGLCVVLLIIYRHEVGEPIRSESVGHRSEYDLLYLLYLAFSLREREKLGSAPVLPFQD